MIQVETEKLPTILNHRKKQGEKTGEHIGKKWGKTGNTIQLVFSNKKLVFMTYTTNQLTNSMEQSFLRN
jgi:hypothetical protein